MNAKIEWYREVLELEPGSKVFFPLARLLGETGQDDEAIRVLRQGVERHPEYFEARLLLVDLLHKAGEDAGAELSGITSMLSAYPGFWSAWSRQSQGSEGLALAFLASIMQDPRLSFEQIFAAGLQVRGVCAGQQALVDTNAAFGAGVSQGSPVSNAPSGPDLASLAQALRTRDSKPKAQAKASEPERASLRTRSMAEVLAEQGDIQGAIDIYTEILAAGPKSAEVDELNARIQLLRGKLDVSDEVGGTAPDSAADASEAEAAPAAEGGKKVRNMLENLAHRLDARAKS